MDNVINEIGVCSWVVDQPESLLEELTGGVWKPYIRHSGLDQEVSTLVRGVRAPCEAFDIMIDWRPTVRPLELSSANGKVRLLGVKRPSS